MTAPDTAIGGCKWCYWDRRGVALGYELLHGRSPIDPGPSGREWEEVRKWQREAAERMDSCQCQK